MKKTVCQRDPEMVAGSFPIWWHPHGSKVCVRRLDKERCLLILAGSAASLRIGHTANNTAWTVEWEVVQIRDQQKASGRVVFTPDQLRTAFGLSDDSDADGDWIIERFGAHAASQGAYIRWRDCLNVPCPGTGHDGDPNISIKITRPIQEAVRKLLE
jgi:hypothetical protein